MTCLLKINICSQGARADLYRCYILLFAIREAIVVLFATLMMIIDKIAAFIGLSLLSVLLILHQGSELTKIQPGVEGANVEHKQIIHK